MRTLRGRLTVWYAVALAATMFVFAAIIYLVQLRDSSAQLDQRTRVEADLIAASLEQAYGARGSLVLTDPQTGLPALVAGVASFMEGIPGLIAVVGRDGDVLYLSADARALPYASLVRFLREAFELGAVATSGIVNLGPPAGEVRYYAKPVTEAGAGIVGVMAGVAAAEVTIEPRRMLGVMMLIAPLILGAAVLIGYSLAGRSLKPVDSIVDEVKAISDGRSLHRRLAPLQSEDELARLTGTLNAMIGRLERSFGTLRRFTADASHELKTPLTVLRAGIERAITHPETGPETLEILDETLRELNRMTDMVDSLLLLARADEGRAGLHLENVDLRDLLTEVAETATILGEQAGVEVEVSAPGGKMEVAADRTRIRQLMLNLTMNAIKYTPAGGHVDVTCAREGGKVVLTVQDTGIGISPADLSHVFDRFWRADPARSRTGQRPGTGLGLAISKWIAEAHGGTIAVTSRPGRGTTFVVTLPVTGGPHPGERPSVTRL